MKAVEEMTRKEFEKLPLREWGQDIGQFDWLVILPLKEKHDSGFRCMDFVACKNNEAICRLSGCSDVLHIGGIGASSFGKTDFAEWTIDCLPKSGLLRLFVDRAALTAGRALSSFEVFARVRK